ncbi:MAG: hypothetical protein A3H57_01805 [Candidatus Taylorbacteria bacterium RIFCSPLOWO2_02_FULL_43_11]|nr:MAG: hypothetical protein A2743_00425 [Candidatus Taylorbacteria bacterium RIFCSPHIGHO2_01_FULL_43_47]OHA30923.1 MAG: hypothetical protein A3B08_03940 [Candidatus Taylorbacteria bacterium RIFCSPLOWO2_01_FULL_43_44]OHA37611.1 MAG: hypothetical protein A3H57_01805 [Candidatus Taylorbacteria bacterium RIFCSPLOWO2_02_FULL_43_11]
MVVKNQFSKTLTFSFLFVLLIYVVTAFRTDSSAMVNPIVVGFFVILFISIAVGTHFYQKHLMPKDALQSLKEVQRMPKGDFEKRRKEFLKQNVWFRYAIAIVVLVAIAGLCFVLFLKNNLGWVIITIDAMVASWLSSRISKGISSGKNTDPNI